jgi:hypothetical protein
MNDIQWTFGIITVYEDKERLLDIIDSIRRMNIPEYEILFVGGGDSSGIDGKDIRKIDFDESIKPIWITRKKNILVKEAKYDNVVVMHDYNKFDVNFQNNDIYLYLFQSNWNKKVIDKGPIQEIARLRKANHDRQSIIIFRR